jgi:hypothetical protein
MQIRQMPYPRFFIVCFLFCYAFLSWRAYNISIFSSAKARDSLHGDGVSEQSTYSAILYFLDHGFTKTFFLPVHAYERDKPASGQTYLHFGGVTAVTLSLFSKLIGSESESALRIFPILFSLFWYAIVFITLQKLLPDKKIALFLVLLLSCLITILPGLII